MERTILICGHMVLVFVLVSLAQAASAQVPQTMNYQGLLTDAGGIPVPDGNYSLTFRLYDVAAGGGALWMEAHPAVVVTQGIFNVILGAGGAPLNLPFDRQYWMGIQVGVEAEMTPRLKLTSAAYSLSAKTVIDGAITAAKLADNAVTAGKIQPNIVSSVDGVSNDGGNIDLVPKNAILITPNDTANTITVGENHSERADNPHNTTAAQTGALVSVEGVSNPGGNINLVPGTNIAISHDDAANTITISSNTWGLTGNSGTSPGTNFLGTWDNVALELRVNGERALRLEPTSTTVNIVGGYYGNTVTSNVNGAVIGGGGTYGSLNIVTDNYGTVGGGLGNQAGDNAGTYQDKNCATVGGGAGNNAKGYASTIGGGTSNNATGIASSIPGGNSNLAAGQYSFAAGRRAKANHNGSFVWGDSTDADVASTGTNQFVVRANGGVLFRDSQEMRISDIGDAVLVLEADTNNSGESDNPSVLLIQDGGLVEGFLGYAEGTNRLLLENRYNDRLMLKSPGGIYLYTNAEGTTGMYVASGGSGWNAVSDRAMKDNIREVDVKDILDRLSGIPISRWNYKTQDPGIQHISPMAQDFHGAFGLGEDDKNINSIDSDGVALAAIQGLYELVKEQNAENAELRRQVSDLSARITALEKLVSGTRD